MTEQSALIALRYWKKIKRSEMDKLGEKSLLITIAISFSTFAVLMLRKAIGEKKSKGKEDAEV